MLQREAMSSAFFKAFVIGLLATGLGLGLLGLGGAWLLVPSPPERFATAVYSFELARGWKCVREGTEYVCTFGNPHTDRADLWSSRGASYHLHFEKR